MSRLTWSWIALFFGGLLEVVWASMLQEAQFLDRPLLLVAAVLLSLVSILAPGWAMGVLPLGIGYAAWIGMGAGGSVIAGLLFFDESATPLRLVFFAAILVGLVGLQFTETGEATPSELEEER